MGLSRLENFLKSARGTILYVDPNSFDSTDSIENRGNSLTRPFKTIQRALIEAARFSYQRGNNNDRFNKTTILLYPGDHVVDNRPGYIPTGSGTYSTRLGLTNLTDLNQWDLSTLFDLSTPDNALYKLNSVYGGVIVPRGTSIVGMDLRKTKIRPLYVPDPSQDDIETSCIFRLTGGCYLWQFTILDSDPNGNCYKNYTSNLFVPNFSHHKLNVFEYADGVNGVEINDIFLNGSNAISTTRTDLDMYYEKVAAVYGPSSGRDISPDYGNGTIDIQPVVDEYRIVGPKASSVGISSIRSGDGVTASTTITVTLDESLDTLSVDSPIQIEGVSESGYDGQYVISTVESDSVITYRVQNTPENPLPSTSGAILRFVVDTVSSASPYIFNISLRSVYGMCGLLADGSKATGFKSMVVAQYTGIGLQKDENAFVKYNQITGEYQDSDFVSNLQSNSKSRFKPEYENYHIKATNDAFIQLVSVFAIGYAQHFVAESGGDLAINNSNSNFGAKALVSTGFKKNAFAQDDYGYITHIIPPREIETENISVEFNSIDVGLTTSKSAGAATTDRLYLYNETNIDVPPNVIINGYHVGAKRDDLLKIELVQSGISTTFTSKITMQRGEFNTAEFSSEKIFIVGKNSVGINSIQSNTLTLTEPHAFISGESIRVTSENAQLPDGLNSNQVYFVSLSGITTNNQIKISETANDALEGSVLQINNKGGTLKIVSRVSDKNAGDTGHPVQWDSSENCWYIGVSTASNQIYNQINSLGVSQLGSNTPKTYITRKPDFRNLTDSLYRVRYVLPKNSAGSARPPIDGYILQDSNNVIEDSSEISLLHGLTGTILNSTDLRNPRFIANVSWNSNVATIVTEIPHELNVGDEIEIFNVVPTVYNGIYNVTSIASKKSFTISLVLSSAPSSFGNNTSARNNTLPYFKRTRFSKTLQIYRTQEVQSYIENVQDGIYYLTLISHGNKPVVSPFTDEAFAQPISNLYPQVDLDNLNSDPNASVCHALSDQIGQIVVDDYQNSITKETIESYVVGCGITNIISVNSTIHTIYTTTDHGLSGITSVSIVNAGSAYGNGSSGQLFNAKLVGFAGSTTGSEATARISIDGSGAITSINIIDGGSAYGIGNTLQVVGVATTTGHSIGVVRVETLNQNANDSIKVFGIRASDNSNYNNIYRITGITTGRSKEINVVSSEPISNFSTTGIGITSTEKSKFVLTGESLLVSSFNYNSVTGLATVGFSTYHSFDVGNKIRISHANQAVFNGDFIVKKIVGTTSVIIRVGIETTSTTATGTIYCYRPTLTSYGSDLINDRENTSGRLIYEYGGITATLASQIFSTDTADPKNINIANAVASGLKLGDYLLIGNEILRISSQVTSDSVFAFRSLFGTPRQTHAANSVIRKIIIRPVELRRNSIIRASGHTFEYLGFGPGNYSTSLPESQDRVLTNQEKFLAQSTKTDGGIVVYTGMNSDGDFFAGNKKINSATGKEETFDTPIPTNTGEKDIGNLVNITETQKLFVNNSIKVEGGRDRNVPSEFDGPVVFNNKVTSSSEIEANSILIQGTENISRKLSVSNEKPTESGNYGDITFNSIPKDGDVIGWSYTLNNEWKEFGGITDFGYGVGISSGGTKLGITTSINFVGTGATIRTEYDSLSGISTVYFEGIPLTTLGIRSEGIVQGQASTLDFRVSNNNKTKVSVIHNITGISSISYDLADVLNLNDTDSGIPSLGITTSGTRIVYHNLIDNTQTNYAVGFGNNNFIWNSAPQNNDNFGFDWYGGNARIASLFGNGNFTISGISSAIRYISTVNTGTAPISVASSTVVTNLNSNYLVGFAATTISTPNTIVIRDSSNNINANASHLIHSTSGARAGEWYTDIPARLGYTPFNRTGDISSGISTFTQISDIYKNESSVGTALTCNFSTGPITRTTSSNIQTINITNVPTTNLRALNYTILLNSTTSVSELSSISYRINGILLTRASTANNIRWLNNVSPTGTAAGYYYFGFTIVKVGDSPTSGWEVLGTFALYE